jgi:hypothetical protein
MQGGRIRPEVEGLSGAVTYYSDMPSRPRGPASPVTRDARVGHHGAWSSRSDLARWRGHHHRADALGAVGPRPRASVLHEECARRPKDGGSSLDRGGDVEAEEELRLDGTPTITVASGGPRQSATHPIGRREREVSEGYGLGEERLRGWCTEEREESGGAGQILMDDGVKRGRESYEKHQLGEVVLGSGSSGMDERRTGRNRDGAVADAFEKRLSGVGQRGKRRGSTWARPRGGG